MSWPSARPSAATAKRRESTGRCSSPATRTRCRSRRSTRRSRSSARTGSTYAWTPTSGYTPTPALSATRSSPTPAVRRDRAHAVAQPARGRRLQVQPAVAAGRRGRTSRRRSRGSRTSCWTAGDRDRRGADHAARLRERVRRRPAERDRPRGDPARRTCTSAPTRSAARRSRYFQAIAETHGLNLEVVNEEVDPTFRFVPLDHDGKIRMDCSSPYVMAGLLELRDRFDVAVGCDPGRRPPRDRHARRRAC